MEVYLTFDEHNFKDEFTITDVRGRGILQNEVELIEVAGKAGAYFSHRKIPVRILEVDIVVAGDNPTDLRHRIREINRVLSVEEPKPIVFSDDDQITYHGIPAESTEGGEIVSTSESTIVFVCADPYSYSPEIDHPFEFDVTTVENNGSEEAEPIFELEVLRPVTFALVQNQTINEEGETVIEDYQMIGRPAEVDEEVIQENVLILEEQGDTIGDWQPPIAEGSGYGQGQFGYDGTGITVLDYGEGSGWHGPARSQEIDPIQDFQVEMHCRVDTTAVGQTYRISFNLYDEDLKEIGMMRIWNNSRNVERVVAEGRVGEYVGDFVNYMISSRNYNLDRRHFHGIIRLTRTGNRFTFYVTRIDRYGKHHDTLVVPFNDVNEEYLGRLKYIQIDIAKHGDSPNPNNPRIQYVKVFHRNEATVDQTPYIADRGDTIIFDHVEDEILINGENMKALKDFGGRYFKLKRGKNTLVVHPADSFATRVRYRETSR